MGTVGSVVLVRFVDNRVWFTFSDSQTALKATGCSPLQVIVIMVILAYMIFFFLRPVHLKYPGV